MFLLVEQSILNNNRFVMTNVKENQKTFAFALMLTILYPFCGLIYTLWHWRENWAKNTFWIACIYMGAVHVYWPEGEFLGTGADGGRYVLRLIEWHNLGYSLKTLFGNYLVDQHTMDLYQQLITWAIAKVTDNGHVLFTLFAIIYGYFYSKNIWYILEKLPKNIPKQFFILITLFFLISPIYFINGARMWTALHVYVYAFMPYLLEKDKKRLWLLLLTPLIHFSYLYVMVIGYLYVLIPYEFKTKNKLFLCFVLVCFIITLFINSLNLNTVADVLVEYSPDAYSYRIEGYVNQNVLDKNIELLSHNNWYVAGSSQIKYWCYAIILIILFPYIKNKFKYSDNLINYYIFTIIISGIANIMSLIPSGGRFQLLAQMFEVSIIILIISRIYKIQIINKFINIFLIVLIVPFIVEIRKIFNFYSITLLFGNFITVFFWENNILLITYIKMLV